MENHILLDIKKMLGVETDDLSFDTDIIIHINSALMILSQIGVGPESPYVITGMNETWDDFLDNSKLLEGVKTYVYLKVKSYFDPPATSFAIEANNRNILEMEWRLSVQAQPNTP